MNDHVYDEAHVVISRLIDRQYNNPLGEDAFLLLQRLVGNSPNPVHVLDVGCGRGRTALWWARQDARVVAFDPSSAMLKEAEQLLKEANLAELVSFECTDLQSFRTEHQFDLIIVHDVLCYSDDRARDLDRILEHGRPQALVSVSDYFGDIAVPSVVEITEAWGIQKPLTFEAYSQLLTNTDENVLLRCETTRQYREHWADIRQRIEYQRSLIIDHVGLAAFERFRGQIDSIENAVTDKHFGHLWAIIEKKKMEFTNV